MKRIIYDTKNDQVIATCQSQELAHQMAETFSYIRNGNAIYGLFGIRLVDITEISSSAWNLFTEGGFR